MRRLLVLALVTPTLLAVVTASAALLSVDGGVLHAFRYHVQAVPDGECDTLPPETICIEIPARELESPEGFACTLRPGHGELSWSAVPGAEGYHVYNSPSGTDGYQLYAEVAAPATTQIVGPPQLGHFFMVAAYDAQGEGPRSAPVHCPDDAPPGLSSGVTLACTSEDGSDLETATTGEIAELDQLLGESCDEETDLETTALAGGDGDATGNDEPAHDAGDAIDNDEPANAGDANDNDEPANAGDANDNDEPANAGDANDNDEPANDGDAIDNDEPANAGDAIDNDEPANAGDAIDNDEPANDAGDAIDNDEPANDGDAIDNDEPANDDGDVNGSEDGDDPDEDDGESDGGADEGDSEGEARDSDDEPEESE